MQLIVRELSAAEHSLWDKLVTISPQRSIFAQRWWMEIVTQRQVRLLGCFQGDRLLAGLPIWPCRSFGIPRLRQPLLTPYWGPLFQPLEGKYQTRLSTEMSILRAFAQALAPCRDVVMQFHPSLINWLPFYWCGYAQTTRYTYRIENLPSLNLHDKHFHKSIYSKLRRAERESLKLVSMIDPMIVAEMSRGIMETKGLSSSAEIQRFWPELSRAALDHGCMFTTAAVDAAGNIHSALAMVWDDRYAYGIYGARNPQFRFSSGGTLTLFHEIEYAATVTQGYDFEGSMIEPIEQHFRQFGGELQPYLLVSRAASVPLRLSRFLHQRLQAGLRWFRHAGAHAAQHDEENAEAPTPEAV